MRALFIQTKDAKSKPWLKWLSILGLVGVALFSVGDLAWMNAAKSGFQEWIGKASQTPEPTVVVEQVQPQVAVASAEPAASEAVSESASAPPQVSEEALLQEQVQAFVDQWAASWSAKNLDSYFYAYSEKFQPEGKKSHSEWVKERTQRIVSKSKIAVQVQQLVIQPMDPGHMRASFTQIYEADGLQSSTLKTLHLSRQEGVWKIIREFTP